MSTSASVRGASPVGEDVASTSCWGPTSVSFREGEEASRAVEGFLFVVDRMVHRATAKLDLPSAQLVFSQLLPKPLDHRRAGDEEG